MCCLVAVEHPENKVRVKATGFEEANATAPRLVTQQEELFACMGITAARKVFRAGR
jgi:hypothetical protein